MQLVRGRAWGAFWCAVVGAVVVHVIHWRRRTAERRAGKALATPSGFIAQVYATAVLVREIVTRLQEGRILKSAEYCPSPAQWAEELKHVSAPGLSLMCTNDSIQRACVRARARVCVRSVEESPRWSSDCAFSAAPPRRFCSAPCRQSSR